MAPMDGVPAWVGLGANVGDARATLEAAVRALARLPDVHLGGVSRLYRTRPVGPVEQADFLNAVVELWLPQAAADPQAAALALLVSLKGLERAFGRREGERWGPRELDLDLLLFGTHRLLVERPASGRSDDASRSGVQWLEVPHPAAAERGFVLAPLADLAAQLEPPGWGLSVAEAAARARTAEGPDAVLVVADWDATSGRWSAPKSTAAGIDRRGSPSQ